MTGKQLVNALEKEGWTLVRVSGSHHIMTKPGCKPASIPVHSGKDLTHGTLNKLLKDTGLKGR